jgi:hypothetical protein
MLRLSSVLMLLLFTACGDDAEPSDAGSRSRDSGADELDDDEELDCTGVFACVDSCRDGDDTCVERCIDRASRRGLPAVQDVLECAENNECEDEGCLAERCEAELLACAGVEALDAGAADGGSTVDAQADCDGAGKPELTGPITGLAASYSAGDPIDIRVPVDQDTARVTVGIYEVGSMLYLGGNAKDVAPSSTASLSLFAGVKEGKKGTFYLSVELCSTSVCTPPVVRNTYQRADRTAPRMAGESYVQTRENVGGPGAAQTCPSSIPVQSFSIE